MLLVALGGFMATCSAAVLFAYLWYTQLSDDQTGRGGT